MRTRLGFAGLICLGLFATGCATVVSGTKQRVHFETLPPGATVKVDGQTFEAPSDVKLSRRHTYNVVVEKPGYVTGRSYISRRTNPALWGNVIIGGVIGMIIDLSTGAAFELDPDNISVTLIQEPSIPAEAPTTGPSPPLEREEGTKEDLGTSNEEPAPPN